VPLMPGKGHTPGCEFAGVVEAVGDEVTLFKVGDEVIGGMSATNAFADNYMPGSPGGRPLGTSALADYCVADEGRVALKPPAMKWEDAGALAFVAVTATAAVNAASLTADKEVVVLGASGGLGMPAMALLREIGCKVIAVCSAKTADAVKEVGGPNVETVDYKTEDWASRYGAAGAPPPDVIIDLSTSPVPPSWAKAKAVLKPSGTFVTMNMHNPDYAAKNLIPEMWVQLVVWIKWMLRLQPRYRFGFYQELEISQGPGCWQRAIAKFAALAEQGKFKMSRLTAFPKEHVHKAFALLKGGGGKIVVTF